MTFYTKKPFIHFIEDSRWEEKGPFARSEELTVLFVDRYTGPRHHENLMPHSFWELTYVTKGKGKLFSSYNTENLKPDCAALIPPGISHYEYSTESLDTVWIGLAGKMMDRLEKKIFVDQNMELAIWIRHLLILNSKTFEKNGSLLEAAAKVILSHFIHKYNQTIPAKNNIDKIINYINDHYNEPLNIEKMAQVMGLSSGYFQRLFKKMMKMSPYEYLLSVRIRQACWWLQQSSEKIRIISQHVGFNDPLYFSKCFKKIVGKSPSVYREELLRE